MTTIEFQHKLIDLQKYLILYAFRLTSNTENAQDLLQETNLKALNYCDRFVCETNFKAWTFTIMKNTFINDYRRRAQLKRVGGENIYPIVKQLKSHEKYNPCSIFEAKELVKTVESIDEKLRIPFKMQHEGYKYREIAEILDLKLGTVKSRVFFARKKLMKQLK